jgi:hypothetical protein
MDEPDHPLTEPGNSSDGTSQPDSHGGAGMSQMENDSSSSHQTKGEEDAAIRQITGYDSNLTGKLCQHVMVLICWKVGADVAVMEHMVQALEEWLHRRGIGIYTDLM